MSIFLVILFGITVISADPCNEYKVLPFADLRIVNNKLLSSDTPIDDINLPPGWYRVGEEDMPTRQPSLDSCGTKIPIWMNGTIPKEEESVVSRTAVAGGYPDTYTINVKNCGEYRVYYLISTAGIEEGYCFGEGESGHRPDCRTSNVRVNISVLREHFSSVYKAKCLFVGCNVAGLLYQVTWYIDGEFHVSLPPVEYHRLSTIDLDESESSLKEMGRRVSCSVRARFTPKGPPGLSTISPNLMMGIEVLTPVVDITREKGGTLRFRPTVDIGCTPPNATSCNLRVVVKTLNKNACGTVGVIGKDCGIEVKTAEWTKELSIPIEAQVPLQVYEFSKVFYVQLSTLDRYRHHRIWSNYQLPEIRVNVIDKTNALNDKTCYAKNDPHMKTFDGKKYDIQEEGTFVLYRHNKHPIQIQSKFKTCRGGVPYCVCGVAVQAGRDVFLFDRCSGYYDYTQCLDGTLDVRRDPKNSRKFRIYTPTGTLIEVSDHNCCGGKFATVSVRPSKRDQNASTGLCGILDNSNSNDFTDSKNQLAPSRKAFYDSWRINVAGAVNLFNKDIDPGDLEAWGRNSQLCTCGFDNKTEPTVMCKSNLASECKQNERLEIRLDTCKVHAVPRRKRSVRSIEEGRRRREAHFLNIEKRSARSVNMSMQQAIDYCRNSLLKSAVFSLCGTVPNVNISDAIEMCAMDILLTNTTDWTDSAREGLKDSCLMELQMNTTLQEKGPDNTSSVADVISEILCPGECSGQGNCIQGVCLCNDGFGSSDCSVDLSIPPFFDALMDDGLCDKQHWACDAALALGDEFVTVDTMKCNMRPFLVDNAGKVTQENEEIVPADIQTMMSLFCPLPNATSRRKRDTEMKPGTFVRGFNVSLSNDGIHFGESQQLFIFDSACQSPVAVASTFEFYLKSDYCFIDNECKSDGVADPYNDCHVCDPKSDLYDWSLRNDGVCIPVKLVPSKSNLWVIGLVGGLLVAAICTGFVMWKMKTKRARKITDSNIFKQSPMNDSSTN